MTTGGTNVRVTTPGAAVNLVTQRGTNAWRAAARYLVTDRDWQSDQDDLDLGDGQVFFTPSPRLSGVDEYGADAGGPILRDRVWMWGGFNRTTIDLDLDPPPLLFDRAPATAPPTTRRSRSTWPPSSPTACRRSSTPTSRRSTVSAPGRPAHPRPPSTSTLRPRSGSSRTRTCSGRRSSSRRTCPGSTERSSSTARRRRRRAVGRCRRRLQERLPLHHQHAGPRAGPPRDQRVLRRRRPEPRDDGGHRTSPRRGDHAVAVGRAELDLPRERLGERRRDQPLLPVRCAQRSRSTPTRSTSRTPSPRAT